MNIIAIIIKWGSITTKPWLKCVYMLCMFVLESDMHTCLYAFCVALSKYDSCLEGVVWMMQSLPSISKFVPFSALCGVGTLWQRDYIISSVDWVFKNCNVKSHIIIMSFFHVHLLGHQYTSSKNRMCHSLSMPWVLGILKSYSFIHLLWCLNLLQHTVYVM